MVMLCDNLIMLFVMLTEAFRIKICDFWPPCSYVLKMTEDRDPVTMEDLYDVQGDLPNGDIADDFECPLKVISGTAYIFNGDCLKKVQHFHIKLITTIRCDKRGSISAVIFNRMD